MKQDYVVYSKLNTRHVRVTCDVKNKDLQVALKPDPLEPSEEGLAKVKRMVLEMNEKSRRAQEEKTAPTSRKDNKDGGSTGVKSCKGIATGKTGICADRESEQPSGSGWNTEPGPSHCCAKTATMRRLVRLPSTLVTSAKS